MTAPGGNPEPEGRIRRSWRLTNLAWDLARRDRTVLVLAVLGVGFATLAGFLVFYLSGYLQHPDRGRGQLVLVGLVAVYPSTLISVFFNVALAKAAGEALEGSAIGVREALKVALRRWDQIALWALISTLVGLLLEQIASRLPVGGRIATALVGAAWALATIFVVPILALEGTSAVPSIRRSSHLVRQRWGEGVTGTLTIAFWVVIVVMPIAFIFCIALSLTRSYPEVAGPIAVADILVIVLVSAFAAALRQVFAVVLYRYATAGATGGFPAADLERPFAGGKAKSKDSAKSTRRTIALAVAGLLAVFVIAGALFHGHRGYYSGPGYWHGHVPATTEIHTGMPVTLNGRRIGEVVNHYPEDGETNVVFHIDPRFDPALSRGVTHVVAGSPGHPVYALRSISRREVPKPAAR
jgi:hypothetical protein